MMDMFSWRMYPLPSKVSRFERNSSWRIPLGTLNLVETLYREYSMLLTLVYFQHKCTCAVAGFNVTIIPPDSKDVVCFSSQHSEGILQLIDHTLTHLWLDGLEVFKVTKDPVLGFVE
jgi:hypothetical protein